MNNSKISLYKTEMMINPLKGYKCVGCHTRLPFYFALKRSVEMKL
jgi:hypothetical protein